MSERRGRRSKKVTVDAQVGFHTWRPYPDDGRNYRWTPALGRQGLSVEAPVGYKVFVKTVAASPLTEHTDGEAVIARASRCA
jgi:hypothetical protein